MGKLTYALDLRVEIEDRALAHLQIVMTQKLRRGEPFLFTWRGDLSTGGGRTSVWLSPGLPISFKFHGSRPPRINPAWIEALAITANSPQGLYLVPEPADSATSTPGSTEPAEL